MDDPNLDQSARNEHLETLKLLDSSIKKLASTQAASPMAAKNSQKPAAKETARRTNITMENLRVLVAEDNADSANLLMDVLEDFGIKNVALADDGVAAFDKIKAAQDAFDLVLCDWDMPLLNGLEVYAKAKASNTLRNAHFMMVTAVSEAARIKEAIQLGVNDYIVKPIDIDVLEAKIRAAFSMDTKKEDSNAS